MTAEGLPDLLTVEEAARLIRVGRTKAYAMTREWRATGGASGLPVVDFGNVLRVPRRALEQLIGAELRGGAGAQPEPVAPDLASEAPATSRPARTSTRNNRRAHSNAKHQPNLFDSITTTTTPTS